MRIHPRLSATRPLTQFALTAPASASVAGAFAALACCLLLAASPRASHAAAGRLDANVVPTFEAIHLKLDAGQPDYSGTVRIDLRVAKETKNFSFHAEEMTITRIELRSAGAGGGGAIAIAHAPEENGVVIAATETPLAPGDYTLAIDFTNEFGTRAVGLYRMEKDGAGYAFTQFEADDAREAFPCWDEPIFKIPFQVTLEVPEAHEALTNTPVESETRSNGWRTIVHQRTKPLPTYLLAVAAGPLEMAPIPGLSVPGRIVTVKGQSHLGELAAQMTPPILRALESYFGRPYPYEKLDLIAIPEYWPGAMEHPGAVTYSDNVLLVDSKNASVGERRRLASITGHELAHMWFGNLVTMEWWDDLWLNEAFADWMGDKVSSEVFPEFKMELADLQRARRSMSGDARPSTQPIRRPVESTDELMQNVGLVYAKGKLVLAMFERWLGPDLFREGVVSYINANQWGNATADDLWKALHAASGKDIDAALATFIEQPGFPRVTAVVLPDNRVRLSQERFHTDGVAVEPLTWRIPVSLKYSDGASVRTASILLSEPAQVASLERSGPIEWIKPNAGGAGYYAWQVPAEMLQAVADASRDALTPAERIEFLGNLSLLLDAGDIAGDEYLRALASFANDPEPQVVSSLTDGLEKVSVAFVPPDLEEAFAAYVRGVLGPALARFGVDARPGEDEAVTAFRPRLLDWLGDRGRDANVLRHAEELAAAYLRDPASIDPSMADVAVELAAMRGDAALFDEYQRRFESATSPNERQRFLGALGNFRDEALRERALAYALAGPLRPNEIFDIPMTIGRTPNAEDRVFFWTLENYGAMTARMPPFAVGFMPFIASGCSAERLARAKEFFANEEHRGPGTENTLAKVSDQVGDCVRLRAREGSAVAAYLRGLAPAAGAAGGAGGAAAHAR